MSTAQAMPHTKPIDSNLGKGRLDVCPGLCRLGAKRSECNKKAGQATKDGHTPDCRWDKYVAYCSSRRVEKSMVRFVNFRSN
jgi:hypothetical protein